jgi:hypothetical protein
MHPQSESALVDLVHEEAVNSLAIAMLRPTQVSDAHRGDDQS